MTYRTPLLLAVSVVAFRDKGHMIGAKIAELQLTDAALTMVGRAMASDEGSIPQDRINMASYGLWMDEVKAMGGRWFDDWHYDDGQITYHESCFLSSKFIPCRRCTVVNGQEQDCTGNASTCQPCKINTGNPSYLTHPDKVVTKLEQSHAVFTRDQDPDLDTFNMALKFFAHTMLDVHQPNHSGSHFSNFGLDSDCSQEGAGSAPQECLSCGITGSVPDVVSCADPARFYPNRWCVGSTPRDSKGDLGSNWFYLATPEKFKPSQDATTMSFHKYFDYGADIWSGLYQREWQDRDCEAIGAESSTRVEDWTITELVTPQGQEYIDCWAKELMATHKSVTLPTDSLIVEDFTTWWKESNNVLKQIFNSFYNPPGNALPEKEDRVKDILKGADCPVVGADMRQVPGPTSGEVGKFREEVTAILERQLVLGGTRLAHVLNETFGKAEIPPKTIVNSGYVAAVVAAVSIPLLML